MIPLFAPDQAPKENETTRRFIQILGGFFNSLVRQGIIVYGQPPDWTLDISGLVTALGVRGGPPTSVAFPTGPRWYASDGPPPASLGRLGDFCLDRAFQAIYRKEQAIPLSPPMWVEQARMSGAGAPGINGQDGRPGPQGARGADGATRTVSGARLDRTTNQSIPDITSTVLTFPTRTTNDGNMTTGTTPWETLTVQSAGWHSFALTCHFASSGSGIRALFWTKNGAGNTGVTGTNGDVALGFSDLYYFDANDVLRANVYQSSGGALNVTEAGLSLVKL